MCSTSENAKKEQTMNKKKKLILELLKKTPETCYEGACQPEVKMLVLC